MSRIEIPENYEERAIILESIVNSVMNETMSARRWAEISSTDDVLLVRAIVDKAIRELENESEPSEDHCESCNKALYAGDDRRTWADGVVTCIDCSDEESQ